MTIESAYSEWATHYDTDRNLTRDLDRSVTAQVLGSDRFATILEAGCGTGKNTELFAAISPSVLAMDLSSGMLARAQKRIGHAHVRFARADLMSAWPCRSGRVDLVSCNLVLEHVPSLDHIFSEAERALVPGGMCFISELHPSRQYIGGQARFVSAEGNTIPIAAYLHHVSDFTNAAIKAGFAIERLDEWWHPEDEGRPPRILSLVLKSRDAWRGAR
jgi:ubiquinone/menaquinone biosynthesis C-methylase UbiE